MFVGHLGAGLAARRLAPPVSLGVLFLATMGLDALLWVFVLLGLETVEFPATLLGPRYPIFVFPYSHGLVASLGWSGLAFAATRACGQGIGMSLVVGATVFSHFALDALVHVAGLPLLDAGSYHVGLALWRHTGLDSRSSVRSGPWDGGSTPARRTRREALAGGGSARCWRYARS